MSFKKRFLAGSLAAVMTLGMVTGCTSVRKSDLSDDYSEVAAATYGDETIYLDEVNYYLRNKQFMYEYYYTMYGMTDIWSSDTMQDSLREEVMAVIYQTRVLCDHAEDYNVELTDDDKELVAESVDSIINGEGNEAFLEIAGADEEMLTNLLTKNALANKVYNAIISETEITATEEDVRQNSISYLLLAEPETEDGTEEETDAADETEEETVYYTEADANDVLKKIQDGAAIADVGEEYGIDVAETNFGVNEEQTSEFGKAAAALKKGESAVAYVEGEGWYVMVCDSENDEDATATAYEDAVEEEKAAHFTEVYEGLEKAKFKVNEKVIETLDIAGTPVYGVEEETESETETAEGESASAESESESETAEGESETAESETEAE